MPETRATHFHANFAVFVEGERIDLSDKKFMEDVSGCRPDYLPMQPKERAHMHNGEDTVAHVHADGVTWGHFFANLGFTFGKSYLVLESGEMVRPTGTKTLKFILNGGLSDDPFNMLIATEDWLLISFGAESIDRVTRDQWLMIPSTAKEHNAHPDPGSCSGVIEMSFWGKVRKAVWY